MRVVHSSDEDIDEFVEWASASISLQKEKLEKEFKESARHNMSADEFVKRYQRLDRLYAVAISLCK